MEQLGGLDAAFLYCETPNMHMHVCGLLALDPSTMPGGYAFEAIEETLLERLVHIPAMRRRVAFVPFNLGRPFWVEDEELRLDRHVHRLSVPPPGDPPALASLASQIASRPLPRDRPLWEMWVLEGLSDGNVAVLFKMHHSTIDGVSGANLMGRLFDLQPDAALEAAPQPVRRARRPTQAELLGRTMTQHLMAPLDMARLLPETAARMGSILCGAVRRSTGQAVTILPFTAPRSSFNVSVTPARSVAFTDVLLDDVKMVKNSFGVTVNDVVTAVMGGALRSYLLARGEPVDRSLIAAEPVSVHGQATGGNTTEVSVMFATLGTNVEDPVERLQLVASANTRAKEIHKMVGADVLLQWSSHFWMNGFGLGARMYSGLHMAEHHRVIHNLILSNVPGPPFPMYLAGARLAAAYPLGPITDGAGLNVTVLSQENRIGFGIVTCPDFVPRVWDLAHAIPEALRELLSTVEN